MATYGGQNYTGFQAINIKSSVVFRVGGFDTNQGTLWINSASLESNRAWGLPDKSGVFPISGTFAVNLPAVTSWGETAVTVTGIRREDTLVCQIRDMGGTVTTGRTFPFLAGARPENGYIYLTFYNPTGTATLYSDLVLSYTASR